MRAPKGTEETDDKNELAKDRTDWAEDRTLLANERTFAGWMRTGMACIALALGMRAVFDGTEPTWIAKAVSTVFIASALGIFYASASTSRRAQKRIQSHDAEAQPHQRIVVIAAALSVGALATGAILWAL